MNAKPLCVALFGIAVGAVLMEGLPAERSVGAAALPNDDRTLVHVLNRMGFGPKPGDLERVRAMGLQNYVDRQLHPERIQDAAVEARLSSFTTLHLSARDLAEQFERPALEARLRRQAAARDGSPQSAPALVAPQGADLAPMSQPQTEGDTPRMPDPVQQRANRPIVEVADAKLLRAIYSERQLQEVLTDFWFNHFNVDARKGADRVLVPEYERDAIRPHVLGKFRDLLGATAKSPAMLFYLDNWMSADPNGPHMTARQAARRPFFGRGGTGRAGVGVPMMPRQPGPQANQPANTKRGLNENYGRELMELHTLGVDGGYTQKDVTEVARAFTGWTIRNPRLGGEFVFEERLHDPGQKVVLGHVIKSNGGQDDGERVLDILAKHPSTARFISTKLAQRFVSDTPPTTLVDKMTARFHDTDGDLREVMRTLLTSPEFLSPDVYRAKVKTPLEFIVSAVRATDADVQDAALLVRGMQQLGMPLYQCQPPTGYKDTADAWVNTGALVNRMNFALQLASGHMRNIAPGDTTMLAAMALGDDISDTTQATIAKAGSPEQKAALTLGSPEFQRR